MEFSMTARKLKEKKEGERRENGKKNKKQSTCIIHTENISKNQLKTN